MSLDEKTALLNMQHAVITTCVTVQHGDTQHTRLHWASFDDNKWQAALARTVFKQRQLYYNSHLTPSMCVCVLSCMRHGIKQQAALSAWCTSADTGEEDAYVGHHATQRPVAKDVPCLVLWCNAKPTSAHSCTPPPTHTLCC